MKLTVVFLIISTLPKCLIVAIKDPQQLRNTSIFGFYKEKGVIRKEEVGNGRASPFDFDPYQSSLFNSSEDHSQEHVSN